MKPKKQLDDEQREWRRAKVKELYDKNYTQVAIAQELHLSTYVVSSDLSYLRAQAREAIQNHIHERMPMEFQRAASNYEAIRRIGWEIADGADKGDIKTKSAGLHLVIESTDRLVELMMVENVLNDALRFVEEQGRQARTELSKVEHDHYFTINEQTGREEVNWRALNESSMSEKEKNEWLKDNDSNFKF